MYSPITVYNFSLSNHRVSCDDCLDSGG